MCKSIRNYFYKVIDETKDISKIKYDEIFKEYNDYHNFKFIVQEYKKCPAMITEEEV